MLRLSRRVPCADGSGSWVHRGFTGEHAPRGWRSADRRGALAIAFAFPLPVCCGKRRMERAREAPRGIPEAYAFEGVLDEDGAETLALRWRHRRATLLLPRKHQAIVTHQFPSSADAARPIGKRTVFGRVGCQFMQRQGDVQRGAGV